MNKTVPSKTMTVQTLPYLSDLVWWDDQRGEQIENSCDKQCDKYVDKYTTVDVNYNVIGMCRERAESWEDVISIHKNKQTLQWDRKICELNRWDKEFDW